MLVMFLYILPRHIMNYIMVHAHACATQMPHTCLPQAEDCSSHGAQSREAVHAQSAREAVHAVHATLPATSTRPAP